MPFKIDGGPAGIWTRVLRLRRCGGTVRGDIIEYLQNF